MGPKKGRNPYFMVESKLVSSSCWAKETLTQKEKSNNMLIPAKTWPDKGLEHIFPWSLGIEEVAVEIWEENHSIGLRR